MNKQAFLLLIVVMKAGFYTCQNIIRLKTDNIMQKSPKFIHLWFDINLRSGIELYEVNMTIDLIFKALVGLFKRRYVMFLLQNFQILFATI